VSSAKNFSDSHSLECLEQRIVDASLCPLRALPLEANHLIEIELSSKENIGVVVLQEYANHQCILNSISMLEQASAAEQIK
jgi:hypothetical protein